MIPSLNTGVPDLPLVYCQLVTGSSHFFVHRSLGSPLPKFASRRFLTNTQEDCWILVVNDSLDLRWLRTPETGKGW